jgi:hypothetical protein
MLAAMLAGLEAWAIDAGPRAGMGREGVAMLMVSFLLA